jgi:hypothetical protein
MALATKARPSLSLVEAQILLALATPEAGKIFEAGHGKLERFRMRKTTSNGRGSGAEPAF